MSPDLGPKPRPAHRPQKILAEQRRRRALELRVQGRTFKEIGRELGCSRQRAQKIIAEKLEERAREIDDLVKTQAETALIRLDLLVQSLWPKAMQGDVDSVQALLRVEERRAKLLGLDAPQRIQADIDLHALPEPELLEIARAIGLSMVVLPPDSGQESPRMLSLGREPVVVDAIRVDALEPEPPRS